MEEADVTMLTVRNLDQSTRDRLKARAAAHGRSVEGEVRAILTAAVTPAADEQVGLGSRIAALFADLEAPVPVRSGEVARVVVFES